MDFLHVLGSIEGSFVSAPDAFEQMLGLFCCSYSFTECLVSFAALTASQNVLHLGVFGMRWCMFVDKGQQGTVILHVQSISFLGWNVK